MGDSAPSALAPWEDLSTRILEVRGCRVILGSDLASLYGVTVRRFHEQVRRNRERFPPDFAFRLTRQEVLEVAANCVHLHNLRYSRRLPLAFPEHGAIMAASVLRSGQAAAMSIVVVRTFVRMRAVLSSHIELAARLAELESRVEDMGGDLSDIMDTLRLLLEQSPVSSGERIGFPGKRTE